MISLNKLLIYILVHTYFKDISLTKFMHIVI